MKNIIASIAFAVITLCQAAQIYFFSEIRANNLRTQQVYLDREGDPPTPRGQPVYNLGSGAYYTVTGSGATTITAGKIKWSVSAVGGTVDVTIGTNALKTLPTGYTLDLPTPPGVVTAEDVVIANNGGTAYWSYQYPK